MPFGLFYASSTFQAMINAVLHDLRDEDIITYIHDILIYPESESEHIRLVQKVLQCHREA